MLYGIPVLGWAVALIAHISLAVPFWIAWTICGIGKTYFYFLPDVYHAPGFWSCVGFFVAVSILKHVVTPRFFSWTDATAKAKAKEAAKK